jgi:3-dehydroquinate synthase
MTQGTDPQPVLIVEKLHKDLFSWLSRYSQVAVLTDANTHRDCYPLVKELLPPHQVLEITPGEQHKNLATCEKLWDFLTQKAFDRKGVLVNLGGGVIGDMGGFCAATYKRGIDFVQIPTTLLAQVDASVGGKLGIDFQGFKNHIGVFQIPVQVLIAPVFLKTLPRKELRSGFAEIVKHCLIADASKWATLRETFKLSSFDWSDLVAHSVAIKSEVVAADPTEKGLRKILNFGHTVGHAIESFYLAHRKYRTLLHGEAIAIGMICEAHISYKKAGLPFEEVSVIAAYLLTIFGRVSIKAKDMESIASLALQDKKNQNGKIMCTLLSAPGVPVFDQPITTHDIIEGLRLYSLTVSRSNLS